MTKKTPPPSPGEARPMTVQELASALQVMIDQGLGDRTIVIPYDPSRSTLGGSPSSPVTGAMQGIDWDQGRVFLTTAHRLGLPDEELKNRTRASEEQLSKTVWGVSRIIDGQVFSAEERLQQIKEFLRPPTASPTKRILKKP